MVWRSAQRGFFFFNDTAATEICTLSLHDALPISAVARSSRSPTVRLSTTRTAWPPSSCRDRIRAVPKNPRSEEHTSELQSRQYLVCRLLLEKKNSTHIFLFLFYCCQTYHYLIRSL